MFKKAAKSILTFMYSGSQELAKIASLVLILVNLLIALRKLKNKRRMVLFFVLIVLSKKRRLAKLKKIFDLNYRNVLFFVYHLIKQESEAQKILDTVFSELGYFKVSFKNMDHVNDCLYDKAYDASISYLTVGKDLISGNSERPLNLSLKERKELIEARKTRARILVKLYRQHLPNDCPDCHKVLKMMYVKQMGEAEVAKELDMSEKQVNDLHLRAFRSLKIEILKGVTGRAI